MNVNLIIAHTCNYFTVKDVVASFGIATKWLTSNSLTIIIPYNQINTELLFHSFLNFSISLSLAFSSREQGTSRPPWWRSTEYLLAPVITQSMVPPRRKKSEHSLDILRGKCPTTTPPFVTATEYRSAAFRGSLLHCTTSPTVGSHISLYIWCPRMHDSLRSSSMIVHARGC